MVVSLKQRIKCFPSTLHQRNLKTEKSAAILDSCSRKTQARISRDSCDVIVSEKFRFQNVF